MSRINGVSRSMPNLWGLLIGVLLAVLSASCNTEVRGPEFTRPQTGAFYTYIGDYPVGDVLAFRTNITGLKLRKTGSTDQFETIFPTSTLYISLKLDFANLRDFSTIMHMATATVGSYDQVVLTLSNPQLVFYDPSVDPPIKKINGRLSTADPAAPLPTDYSIVKDKLNVVHLDFDMLKSIQLDQDGQVTDNVTPHLTATPVAPTPADGYGFFDNLSGFVRTVSPNPISGFSGSFVLQTIGDSGPALTVYVTSGTDMYGVSDLRSLETGRFVELGAYVDEKGNVVARTVEVEDRAIVEEKRIAFIGTVLPPLVKDASGNVTQFKLYVRAEEPDMSREIPLDSIVTVNVPSSAYFQVSSRPSNFAFIPFDATSIVVGQDLIVHGKYTLTTDQPTVVDASSIYLKIQTMQGGLASLIHVGSDGKSGAFQLGPSATLLRGTPILVMTYNQTAFVNVFGLAEILPQAPLLVRGLPFYVKEAALIRDIPVPAGTVVFLARQVHQLQ